MKKVVELREIEVIVVIIGISKLKSTPNYSSSKATMLQHKRNRFYTEGDYEYINDLLHKRKSNQLEFTIGNHLEDKKRSINQAKPNVTSQVSSGSE